MKNIIFDWSGVVKDAVGAQLWKVNKIFERYEVEKISMEEFRKNFKQPYMDFYHTYLPNLGIVEQDEIYRELSFNKDCPESNSFPNIVNLIKRLKEEGNYLAIVSSDFSETLLPEMKKYGLDNIFQDIITYVHNKEEGIYSLIKKRKLNKSNTYFIGDSNHEIEVSKITGIKSIAVTWGFATEETLKKENPDFIVHNIKELEEILFTK